MIASAVLLSCHLARAQDFKHPSEPPQVDSLGEPDGPRAVNGVAVLPVLRSSPDAGGLWRSSRKEIPRAASQEKPEPSPKAGAGAASPLDPAEGFSTVVRNHFSANAKNGYWPMELEDGRTLRLKFKSVDAASLHKSGPGEYTGRVLAGRRGHFFNVALAFTVEFSPTGWRVKQFRLLKKKRDGAPKFILLRRPAGMVHLSSGSADGVPLTAPESRPASSKPR